jgi:dTMP kinase
VSPQGVFITIEGGEGAGKSTQIARLADRLRAAGHEVLTTREPGGTPGAEAIRALMLDPARHFAPLADTLLVFAARADHVAAVIRPALERGAVVLCDRFTDSTMAYQGYGLGVGRTTIATLETMIDLTPDLTLILDLPEPVARARLARRGSATDRYEQFDAEFAARVAAGFRAIAATAPERCVVVDAASGIEEITDALAALIRARLGLAIA